MNGNYCGNMNGNYNAATNPAGTNDYLMRGLNYQQQDWQPPSISPSYNYRQAAPVAPPTEITVPMPKTSYTPPTPTTLESTNYLAGLLTTVIGQKVRVQFLIGTTGPLIDVLGTLTQVGANYIIIQPIESDDLMICDLYSIKFVTVLR